MSFRLEFVFSQKKQLHVRDWGSEKGKVLMHALY